MELVMEGRKSLDMFFALIIYAGWGYYYCTKGPINLTTAINLTITLASELGLLKPVARGPFALMKSYNKQSGTSNDLWDSSTTIEERRAVLGLFYIASV